MKSPKKENQAESEELKLTFSQRRFCELLVEGRTQVEAYRLAFGKPDRTRACRLMKYPAISAYLVELRRPLKAESVLNRQLKREFLFAIATGKVKATAADRIRAIQVDNQMTGDNAPIKVAGELTLRGVLDQISTSQLPSEEEEH